jgi:hypothetical protein
LRKGSMTVTLPVVLVMRKVAWPSHRTSNCSARAIAEHSEGERGRCSEKRLQYQWTDPLPVTAR